MNNKTLVERLAEVFFTSRTAVFFTGRGVSQFVKITYNFHTNNDEQSACRLFIIVCVKVVCDLNKLRDTSSSKEDSCSASKKYLSKSFH